MPNFSGFERRELRRIHARLPLVLTTPQGVTVRGYTTDISTKGVGAEIEVVVEPGPYLVRIELPDGAIHATLVVRHVDLTSQVPTRYHIGGLLTGVSKRVRTRLGTTIARLSYIRETIY